MSLQNGSVKFTGVLSRGRVLLAFLGVVELVLTAVFVITLASNILFPEQAAATANAVSKIISYEGRLTDASGNALGGTGTNYCFRFSIYDNQTVGAGTKVWPATTPNTNTVNVVNGVFTVGIGEVDDLGSYSFYDNDTVYLNIEATSSLSSLCSGQTSFVTLSPRQRFDAVAFARASRDVYGSLLKTVNASNLVQVGTGSGAATPILLGLDWKNVADGTLSYVGQSCSTNGTMWYNSSVSRALICEGGLVQELGTGATTTIAAIGTNGTGPITAGTVVFSNSNGVSFGQNGSTITASVAAGGGGGPTLQGSGTYTQSTGTIQFANSNGLTFGLSNNGVMTGSHNGLSNFNFSAGTTSNNLSNLVFSNSNGVTFGLNGSTVTASVAAGGGGGGYAIQDFANISWRAFITNVTNMTAVSQRPIFVPFVLPGSLTWNQGAIEVSRATSGSNLFTMQAAIYTYVNATQISRLASLQNTYSNTNTASISGVRRIIWTGMEAAGTTLTPGVYVLGLNFSAAATASMNYSLRGGQTVGPPVGNIGPGANANTTATSQLSSLAIARFQGRYTATSGGMPASVNFTQVQQYTSGYPIYFHLQST